MLQLPKIDSRTRRWIAGALGAAVALGGAALVTNAWVVRFAGPFVYEHVGEVPRRQVAIVPGARVYADGRPSPVLADRLSAALALYRSGSVGKILVSGEHLSRDYDEAGAMWRWLDARGVDPRDVFLDHAGLRTLDTMERARQVFEVGSAVICTQRFHLARSVFLARRAGIDAVGVVADRRVYRQARRDRLREYFARSVSFFDSYVLGTGARYAEGTVPIDGDGRQTHDQWTRGPAQSDGGEASGAGSSGGGPGAAP